MGPRPFGVRYVPELERSLSSMEPEVVFFTSSGTGLRGWFYRPAGNGPHPTVVIAHGYSVTHPFIYWRVAEALRAAGYAVLDFDQRYLGASEGEPRQRVDLFAQIDDVRAALAYVRGRPDVDPARVAVYGTSGGGGVGIEVAVTDPELAALLLVVPHVDGLTNAPTASVGFKLWLLGRILGDGLGRLVGRAPATIPVFGRPGTRALITQDDCMDAIEEEREPSGSWVEPGVRYVAGDAEFVNRATCWEILQVFRLRPGRKLASVAAPTLMVIGSKDTLSPPGPQ